MFCLQASKGDNSHYSNARSWDLTEDWALTDAVPLFTIEDSTFWVQLCAATPALAKRDVQETRDRYISLQANNTSLPPAGEQPPVLLSWQRDERGFTGRLAGRTISFPVEVVGTLRSDSASAPLDTDILTQPGAYVVGAGGKTYELGNPMPANTEVSTDNNWNGAISKDIAKWTTVVGALFLSGFIGFGVGSVSSYERQFARSSPPSVNVYRRTSSIPPSSSIVKVQPEQAILTLSEQRTRQEQAISARQLRLEKEGIATERLSMRIKADNQRLLEQQERLEELKRLESEKGGDAIIELPR